MADAVEHQQQAEENTVMIEGPSKYLTKDLFYSIIRKHAIAAQPFEITNFKCTDAVLAGNNFLSKILKISTQIQHDDGTNKELSFIAKVLLETLATESLMDGMEAFPKELGMYRDIVPEYEDILKNEAGIDVTFTAKLYHGELKPTQMLVFENLNETGYKVADRFVGLSEEQVLLVLEKIAKWHAASRVYCERHKPIDGILTTGLVNSNTIAFLTEAYDLLYINLVEALSNTSIDERHLEIIKSWNGKIGSNLLRVTCADPNEFNVLNHGDLWTNNMLFLENETGEPIDVKFIDLQLGNYGSPALDLIYFFVASIRHELLAKKFDEFVAYYHKHLMSTLKSLNHPVIPTLKEIHMQLLNKSFYSVIMLSGGLATIMTDYQNDGVELYSPSYTAEEAYAIRKKMVEHPRILNNLLGLFKFMGDRGLLEL